MKKNTDLWVLFTLSFILFNSLSCAHEILGSNSKSIRNLEQNSYSERGGAKWIKKYSQLSKGQLIVESLVPPFFKDSFNSVEDFITFAETPLLEGVSGECSNHMKGLIYQVLLPLTTGEITAQWAIEMIDAWGKFPAGLLSGHITIPGDFHECLRIRGDHTVSNITTTFKGRYCSTNLVPGKAFSEEARGAKGFGTHGNERLRTGRQMGDIIGGAFDFLGEDGVPFVGTCFPSSCSNDDVTQIFLNFYDVTTDGYLAQSVLDCYIDEKPPFDAGDITVISILSVIAVLCLIGSVIDIYFRYYPGENRELSLARKLILSFSVPLNTEKLLSKDLGSGNLGCLHGLRFLTIAWVVLGHSWEMNYYQLTWNLIDLQNIYQHRYILIMINATAAVDTFFVISGTLLSYNLLRELDKNKGKFNYPLMVVHRYLRITPTYMMIIAMMATVVPYLGYGPTWYNYDRDSEKCTKYWWAHALYITTWFNEDRFCYGESWYLSNDMQYFLLAPIMIYPMWRWRRIGLGLLGLASFGSIFVLGYLQRAKELVPVYSPFLEMKTFYKDVYLAPWCRVGPYLVGLLLGYILQYRLKNPSMFQNIPKWAVLIGWTYSTVTALLIVFGIKGFFNPAEQEWATTSMAALFYASLYRYAWGLVIAWIIFACVSGYGGWVNRLLSWSIFVPLGRLVFCVYISSWHMQEYFHLLQTHPIHYHTYGNLTFYCAHLVMAFILAYVLSMTLESPVVQLEKLLLPQKKSRAQPSKLPVSEKIEEASASK